MQPLVQSLAKRKYDQISRVPDLIFYVIRAKAKQPGTGKKAPPMTAAQPADADESGGAGLRTSGRKSKPS